MTWITREYATVTVHELEHPDHGIVCYVSPTRAKNSWEIEFVVEDLDLYWNEVFCGSLEEAKGTAVSIALGYMDRLMVDIAKVREWFEKETV